MAEMNKQSAAQWVADALDLKTIVILLTLAIGWLGNWYSMSGRVGQLELRTSQLETKIDKELVPRAEQDVRNSGVEKRLDNIENVLVRIEAHLEKR